MRERGNNAEVERERIGAEGGRIMVDKDYMLRERAEPVQVKNKGVVVKMEEILFRKLRSLYPPPLPFL